LNQHLADEGNRIGHLPSLLYREDWRAATTDVTLGRSGMYRACGGWDPCTGLGSPNGKKLLELVLASE
jgi:kumamolisin